MNRLLLSVLLVAPWACQANAERARPRHSVLAPDGTIYLAMSTGLYESKDNARSWRAIPDVDGFMASVGVDEKGNVLAGSNRGESIKLAGTTKWRSISIQADSSLQGGTTYIPAGGGVIFSSRYTAMFRSADLGKSWTRTRGLPMQIRGDIVQIPGALLALAEGENVAYESQDKGLQWEKSKAFGGLQGRIDGLHRDTRGTLYVVTTRDRDNRKAFFKRERGSANWQPLHLQTEPHPGTVGMFDHTAYVAGATWELRMASNFEKWTVCSTTQAGDSLGSVFSVIKTRTGLLMLSSVLGVFRSEDGGKNWISSVKGLPAPPANLKNPTIPLSCT